MKSLISLFLILSFSVPKIFAQPNENLPAKADSSQLKKLTPAIVAPFGDSLFSIYEKVGPFAPETRAKAISDRLQGLEEEIIFSSDSFRLQDSEFTTDILYNDLPVMAITDADARHENMSREELAKVRLSQIKSAAREYREEFSWKTILKKTLLLVVLLAFLGLLIYGVNRLFRWFYQLIRTKVSPHLRGFKIGRASFTNVEKISELLIRVAKWIKIILLFIVIYISLPLIIYLIPSSKSFTDKLLEYTLTPLVHFFNSFLDYIPNLFTIAIIVLLFTVFLRLFKFFFQEIASGGIEIKGFYKDWALPTFSIIRFILYAFMLIVIFPYLPGSSSPIFQGVSVFLGLLVSLGSAGSISNIIAGIVITYMRSFDVGDRIRVGDVEGDVVEKAMLVTRIKTIKNEEISVPNGTLMSGNVMNFSMMARENKLIIYTSVTIGYDARWRDVHKALLDAAARTNRILKEPVPFVLQHALNDFYVEYQINGYINDAQAMADIYSDLHQSIQDSFNEAGIEIMSSHYMNLRDGNKTTTPESYLPKDYERPGFKIEEKK